MIEDLKRKSNPKGFKLKQINDELVLQKYEEMMNSEEETVERTERTEEEE